MIHQLTQIPLIIYLKRLSFALFYQFRYRGKHLKIGSMSLIRNCSFGRYNTIYNNVQFSNSQIDDFSYIGDDSNISNTQIGKFCSISSGVKCGLGSHPTKDFVSTHPAFFSIQKQAQIAFVDKNHFTEYKNTTIGNDVWIGANAVILDGVTIADGAVIGAGAIVTKDVEPYAIVGGIPAKLIRYRFEQKDIDFLLKTKWWNKDEEWLKKHYLLFKNIKKFNSDFKKKNNA